MAFGNRLATRFPSVKAAYHKAIYVNVNDLKKLASFVFGSYINRADASARSEPLDEHAFNLSGDEYDGAFALTVRSVVERDHDTSAWPQEVLDVLGSITSRQVMLATAYDYAKTVTKEEANPKYNDLKPQSPKNMPRRRVPREFTGAPTV